MALLGIYELTRLRNACINGDEEDQKLANMQTKFDMFELTFETRTRPKVCECEEGRLRLTVNAEPRTFCRTVRRVTVSGEVKWLSHGAEVKASVKSA